MRYGVRFASETREEAPPRGDDGECCCGVVQLPWSRGSPSPSPSSRIPLPAAAAINKRSIFSRINSAALARGPAECREKVYRSSLEWSQRDDPPRRRVLVRPKPDIPAYFKLCSSASSDSSEACRLITPSSSRDTLAEENRGTLDRFNKIRLGGGENKDKKKVPRSSDKTEGLRRLTERLKGGGSHSSPDRRRHPAAVAQPAARDQHDSPGDGTGSGGSSAVPGTAGECRDSASAGAGDVQKTSDSPMKEDDIFGVNLRLAKPESRSIVGSYAQRTIPIRSASFSQVDFSSADGKYIRSCSKPTSPFSCFPSSSASGTGFPLSSTSVIASCSLTLPRKKLSDVRACTEEPLGSTPSVDSAVGSDEGYTASATSKIPVINKEASDTAHRAPGSRSLTYPLPKRGSRPDDDIPFSSIDGNGLKSLQYISAGRELQQVQEENEASLADFQQSSTQEETEASLAGFQQSSRQEESEGSLADFQQSSRQEEPVHKTDEAGVTLPSGEADIFHDWRKAEECHLTYEPPVCLGEVVVCNVEQSESPQATDGEKTNTLEPSPEQSCSCSVERSIPEVVDVQLSDSNTRDASQYKDGDDVRDSGEYIIMHLTSVGDSSDANKAEEAENQRALEEPLNPSQENKSTIEEWQNVVSDSDASQGVFITQWPDQGGKNPEEVTPCDSGDWQDSNQHVEEAEKSLFSDVSQEGVESCTDAEDNPPTHTVSIVSPQWHHTEEWDSAQEESLSPDEGGKTRVRWPRSEREGRRWLEKPKLVYQSSEEKEDDNPSSTPRRYHPPVRSDSLSEGESDQGERSHVTRECTASPSPFAPSDLSDSEGRSSVGTGGESRSPHTPRRYYKRPLRGPYGQMLEAEMSKAETNRIPKLQLEFLEKYVQSPASADAVTTRPRALTTQSLDDSQLKGGYGRSSPAPTPTRTSPKRKVSANIPYTSPGQQSQPQQQFVCHQRTTSSPSQLEGFSGPSPRPELLAELLRGSPSERVYNGNSSQHGKVSS